MTKPALTPDIYQRKHQATIETRLEKLEEYCMRHIGNRTTRERPQPSRRLEGSSRDVMSIISKVVWDKLDIRDQDDTGLKWVLRLGRKVATLNARRAVSVPVPDKHGPPGAMRCGDTVDKTDNVETTVITTLVSKVTDCTDESREKRASLLRQYAETISMSDDDLGRTSVVKRRIIVEGAKPIKQSPRRLPIRQQEEIETHVRRMLERGLIEPAKGSWSSPRMLVKKKDGCATVTSDRCNLGCFSRCQVVHDIGLSVELLARLYQFNGNAFRTMQCAQHGRRTSYPTKGSVPMAKEVGIEDQIGKVPTDEETGGLPRARHHTCGNRDRLTKDSGKALRREWKTAGRKGRHVTGASNHKHQKLPAEPNACDGPKVLTDDPRLLL
ncbi:hypothetical protein T10_1406 [Trichinella papuae]|uniref:Retrovirus-related Pol polyprotein from transposon n=1 Tax=Trichinella papuae TaxID=268474 RepID=A0A0V1NAV3_9BILA|nr:hypothetical protein T10_1406 [Trichinella papuae]